MCWEDCSVITFAPFLLQTYLIQWLLQTFFPLSLPFAACLYGRRGLSVSSLSLHGLKHFSGAMMRLLPQTMSFWPLRWRDKDRVPDILWQWGTSTLMITAIIIRFTFCLGNACNAASDIVVSGRLHSEPFVAMGFIMSIPSVWPGSVFLHLSPRHHCHEIRLHDPCPIQGHDARHGWPHQE